MASSIKKTAVALVTILTFLSESVECSMPLLDPTKKVKTDPIETFIESDPAKYDNEGL